MVQIGPDFEHKECKLQLCRLVEQRHGPSAQNEEGKR